jgi:hypothetical protein
MCSTRAVPKPTRAPIPATAGATTHSARNQAIVCGAPPIGPTTSPASKEAVRASTAAVDSGLASVDSSTKPRLSAKLASAFCAHAAEAPATGMAATTANPTSTTRYSCGNRLHIRKSPATATSVMGRTIPAIQPAASNCQYRPTWRNCSRATPRPALNRMTNSNTCSGQRLPNAVPAPVSSQPFPGGPSVPSAYTSSRHQIRCRCKNPYTR